MNKLFFIFIFLFIFIFNVSCQISEGTDHGNPSNPGSGSELPTSQLQTLLTTACVSVHTCFSNVSTTACESELKTNTSAPAEINQASFSNLTNVIAAESAGTLAPSTTPLTQCGNAIQNASCSDTAVFDSGLSSSSLTQIYKIFRASSACQSLYL